MVEGCDCVAVVDQPAAIDYVTDAQRCAQGQGRLGVVGLIELDNEILGGESGALQIAQRLEISKRTVERRRRELRSRGYRLRVPDNEDGNALSRAGRGL